MEPDLGRVLMCFCGGSVSDILLFFGLSYFVQSQSCRVNFLWRIRIDFFFFLHLEIPDLISICTIITEYCIKLSSLLTQTPNSPCH